MCLSQNTSADGLEVVASIFTPLFSAYIFLHTPRACAARARVGGFDGPSGIDRVPCVIRRFSTIRCVYSIVRPILLLVWSLTKAVLRTDRVYIQYYSLYGTNSCRGDSRHSPEPSPATDPPLMRHGFDTPCLLVSRSVERAYTSRSRVHRVHRLAGPACGPALEDGEGVLEVLVRLEQAGTWYVRARARVGGRGRGRGRGRGKGRGRGT